MKTENKDLHIGIDIGGTFIKSAVVDENGSIKHLHSFATEKGYEAILSTIKASLKEIFEKEIIPKNIKSIGLGVPGTTDPLTGNIIFAPNIFLKDVNIAAQLKKEFGIPVFCTQDSRAAAWGEYLAGKGKGFETIVCITLGTGIGCGIIINGKIFHGGLNTAGEFGHQIIRYNGRECNCGKKGCLEAYAGGPGLLKSARERFQAFHGNGNERDISVKTIFDMAVNKNKEACTIIEELIRDLGTGLVNLVNILSPQLITLSGGISNAPDYLLFDELVKFVKTNGYPACTEKLRIEKSGLDDSAPVIGAALLYKAYDK